MAVTYKVAYELVGLSTDDPKPTDGVEVNTIFHELDTGDDYYYNGEEWAKVGGESAEVVEDTGAE